MDPARIADLLAPFLDDEPESRQGRQPPAALTPHQLNQISIYIDLLRRWNARINLTSIRTPEEIVTRHFGESLFVARHFVCGAGTHARETRPSKNNPEKINEATPGRPVKNRAKAPSILQSDSEIPNEDAQQDTAPTEPESLVDLGSGAGFPGLPIKIWSPQTPITLIESNQKKVAFLREVIRALTLTAIDVFPGRAEDHPHASTPLVALRAVEHFEAILPMAARLLTASGTLALLIGRSQVEQARAALPHLTWSSPISIPLSQARAFLLAKRSGTDNDPN